MSDDTTWSRGALLSHYTGTCCEIRSESAKFAVHICCRKARPIACGHGHHLGGLRPDERICPNGSEICEMVAAQDRISYYFPHCMRLLVQLSIATCTPIRSCSRCGLGIEIQLATLLHHSRAIVHAARAHIRIQPPVVLRNSLR